jgi:hypothetical protein
VNLRCDILQLGAIVFSLKNERAHTHTHTVESSNSISYSSGCSLIHRAAVNKLFLFVQKASKTWLAIIGIERERFPFWTRTNASKGLLSNSIIVNSRMHQYWQGKHSMLERSNFIRNRLSREILASEISPNSCRARRTPNERWTLENQVRKSDTKRFTRRVGIHTWPSRHLTCTKLRWARRALVHSNGEIRERNASMIHRHAVGERLARFLIRPFDLLATFDHWYLCRNEWWCLSRRASIQFFS